MSAKAFVDWARGRCRDVEARGGKIDLFVLPDDAEVMLFKAAAQEHLTDSDYKVRDKDSWLVGVKVLWTKKLPHGQAWWRIAGGKVPSKTQGEGQKVASR